MGAIAMLLHVTAKSLWPAAGSGIASSTFELFDRGRCVDDRRTLSAPRVGHAAAMLKDGRCSRRRLGWDGRVELADIFDPTVSTIQTDLSISRVGHGDDAGRRQRPHRQWLERIDRASLRGGIRRGLGNFSLAPSTLNASRRDVSLFCFRTTTACSSSAVSRIRCSLSGVSIRGPVSSERLVRRQCRASGRQVVSQAALGQSQLLPGGRQRAGSAENTVLPRSRPTRTTTRQARKSTSPAAVGSPANA